MVRASPAGNRLPLAAVLAVRAARFGGDDPLANLEVVDVPEPTPGPGEVLLAVTAASLNHHDLWTLRGVGSRRLTEPQVLGCDAAGTVLAYGDGEPPAGAPPVGDAVVVHSVMTCGHCAACRAGDELHCPHVGLLSEPPYPGTLAERLVVPVANVLPLPATVDAVTAACLPTAYLTAYRMLFVRGGLRPGQRALVHGVTGGVASAAIILGAAAGLTVFATSRDEAKRAIALELGATAAFATDRDATQAGDRQHRRRRRRGDRHGGGGHVGLLPAGAAAGGHGGGVRRHQRAQPTGPAQPHLLAPPHRGGEQHGNTRGAGAVRSRCAQPAA